MCDTENTLGGISKQVIPGHSMVYFQLLNIQTKVRVENKRQIMLAKGHFSLTRLAVVLQNVWPMDRKLKSLYRVILKDDLYFNFLLSRVDHFVVLF